MSDKRQKGLDLFRDVYGDAMGDGLEAYLRDGEGFGFEIANWTTDFDFGSIWAREGMERKMRSAAVLGMLIALRQTDEIRFHTRMGLANGLTRQELEEIVYSAVAYAGFPAANTAKAAMLEAFAELDSAQHE